MERGRTSFPSLSTEVSTLAAPPKPDTLALTPQDVVEACATLIPPFSVVFVNVDAIDSSVECSTEASKLADAPALVQRGFHILLGGRGR